MCLIGLSRFAQREACRRIKRNRLSKMLKLVRLTADDLTHMVTRPSIRLCTPRNLFHWPMPNLGLKSGASIALSSAAGSTTLALSFAFMLCNKASRRRALLLLRKSPCRTNYELTPSQNRRRVRADMEDPEFFRLCERSNLGDRWNLALAKVPKGIREDPRFKRSDVAMQRLMGNPTSACPGIRWVPGALRRDHTSLPRNRRIRRDFIEQPRASGRVPLSGLSAYHSVI